MSGLRIGRVVAVLLVVAGLVGVLGCGESYDKEIPLNQLGTAARGSWQFTVTGGGWRDDEVTVELTIKYDGEQPDCFDCPWVANDVFTYRELSRNVMRFRATSFSRRSVNPSGREGWVSNAWFQGWYYPGETRAGKLRFDMRFFFTCEETRLYVINYRDSSIRYLFFELGAPMDGYWEK